ncbi:MULTISPECIES: AEC family transporter [Streptomyces]|uniref:AEC family transporter n=1 Tax=Streptomyces TaxID=1883 RepID=UPI000CD4A3FD|nr:MULTISPECIES: AEC family transporter [Streptomyces]
MGGVIAGFATISVIIAVGYAAGRLDVLGDNGRQVLTRLAFSIATPALLFTVLAEADLSVILSAPLVVTALSTLAAALIFVVVAVIRRWGLGYSTLGALCASYVNAGNLGIPIAAYVLGDASLVAPVLLLQQLLIAPVALTVLDIATSEERRGVWQQVTTPFRNPVVIGSLAGLAVNIAGLDVPALVMDPVTLIGGMSVPAVLLAFGISLHGRALPARGPDRWPVLLSVLVKVTVQPFLAWAIGWGAFGLEGEALFAVVVVAALPAAQNLFTYASRYDIGTTLARDSVLLSTILAAPALVVVTVLLR